jgi:D-arabinose 1-dehydrogenase-like Zn-dependent alcohol dehydrogenase
MIGQTYRAAQAIGGGKLELATLPMREPGVGEVRIRVEACGICHTDVLTVDGGYPGIAYPRVPGHEVVGRIDALGAGVSHWRVGQRVGVGFLGGSCGHCEFCRRGDLINCKNQVLSGIHYDGGYAEVMIAKDRGLVSIPNDMSAVEAAPLLCAGVTTFNALRKSPALAGELVVIHGLGGLGHLAVQFARYMGFRAVVVARGADKAELAMKLGAHAYIDSEAENAAKALRKMGGASVVVATVSSTAAMAPLIGSLRPHGQLAVVGAGLEPLKVNVGDLIFGERSIIGVNTGSPIEIEDTLGFSQLQNIRAMTEAFPLEQVAEAYERMHGNKARFRVVLTMGA